jgi:hypothetical protein
VAIVYNTDVDFKSFIENLKRFTTTDYRDGENKPIAREEIRKALVFYLMEPWMGKANRLDIDPVKKGSDRYEERLNVWANKAAKDFLIAQNNQTAYTANEIAKWFFLDWNGYKHAPDSSKFLQP